MFIMVSRFKHVYIEFLKHVFLNQFVVHVHICPRAALLQLEMQGLVIMVFSNMLSCGRIWPHYLSTKVAGVLQTLYVLFCMLFQMSFESWLVITFKAYPRAILPFYHRFHFLGCFFRDLYMKFWFCPSPCWNMGTIGFSSCIIRSVSGRSRYC